MLVVTIRRHGRSDAGTQGGFVLRTAEGREERFDTLEPRDSIPAGTYAAYLHKVKVLGRGGEPEKMRRVYELQDVPDHAHVEIDSGEFAGDVRLGYFNNMLGKIAIGYGFVVKLPPGGMPKPQVALQHSEAAVARLMKHTHGLGIMVEIIDL